jgi:hypothetical protein
MLAFLTKFDFSMDESHQYPPVSSIFYRMLARFHVSCLRRSLGNYSFSFGFYCSFFVFGTSGEVHVPQVAFREAEGKGVDSVTSAHQLNRGAAMMSAGS